MLSGFNQHEGFSRWVDPGMGETSGVERFVAAFTDNNFDISGVQHGAAAYVHLHPGEHRAGYRERAVGNSADSSGDFQWFAR